MIAKTIFEQIGGRRFAAMTGSKDFIDMGNALHGTRRVQTALTSSTMQEQIYIICVSTARPSAKRPLSAG